MSSIEPCDTVHEDANHEPCPTPLNWQQVLQSFRDQSQQFTVSVDGTQLQCRRYGSGQPLYLVNGLTGNCELFSLLAYVLAEEFECIVYEVPDRIANVDRVDQQLSRFLLAVADSLGHQSIDVFTGGFGCVAGFTAAIETDRIRRLVVQSAFANRKITWSERLLLKLFKKSSRTISDFPLWNRINQQNHRMWFPPFDDSRWEFLHDNTGSTPVSRIAWQSRAFGQFDVRDRLGELTCPALIVSTEGDGRVLEACHEDLQAGVSGAKFEQMDNTGQFAFLTHPHRLRKQLRLFLLDDV